MTDQITTLPLLTNGPAEMLRWLKEMRDEQPVWVDKYGIYHVFRYDDVQQVSTDPAVFSSDTTRLYPELSELNDGSLIRLDPPLHRKHRRLISTAFTPKMVAGLEPRITEVVRELLAGVPDGPFDLVEQLTYPLPVIVIAELLGLPTADRSLFRKWADGLMSMQIEDPSQPGLKEIIEDAQREMKDYLRQQVLERRSKPTDDLIGQLTAAEVDGERLSDTELVNFATLLLLAGHITTTLLLGNAMLCLRDNPGAAAEMRADHSLIPGAVEEVLRYRSPILRTGRVTNVDVEIAGHTIPADKMVSPWLLSANHDERQFTDPERFDIHRDPNKQDAFGHGVHFCLGAPLARLEGRIAVTLLLETFADLEVVDVEQYPQNFLGVKSLTMTAQRN